ncbi:hypothetical protein [Hamadaea tsunoensis]|uniref:hypothetical protein n=1 Tax=Hamadaea tsunoensis TaxID=53368 RepID=UPI001B7FDF88|nr:hypothetical protein [Hamadaea tsunoensis]
MAARMSALVLALAVAACGSTAPTAAGPDAVGPNAAGPNAAGPDAAGSSTAGPSTSASAGIGAAATAAPSASTGAGPGQGSCDGFPADNIWRADVSRLPADPASARYIASIGTASGVHADFGSGTWDGGPIGIPVTTVPAGQKSSTVRFAYAGESDKGPYPIPAGAAIEGGPQADGDRHVVLHDPVACKVYELFAAEHRSDGWHAGSGAVFDLRSDRLRPAGWTSADAAGLSIFAGLVRYSEVASGHIDHAIRVTVPRSRTSYVWPARHAAGQSADAALPPMGLRLRLKAGVDVSKLPKQARIVAEAMKKYGLIVADNGSPWYISGTPDSHWDNDALHALGGLTGSDFEAVNVSTLMVSANSAAAR